MKRSRSGTTAYVCTASAPGHRLRCRSVQRAPLPRKPGGSPRIGSAPGSPGSPAANRGVKDGTSLLLNLPQSYGVPPMAAPGPADAPADGPGGRKLYKGRLKPPTRDPVPSMTTQPAIRKNELIIERPGSVPRAPAIEICSTALPQPFLNPDAPLSQQNRANSSA